jgi:hypothetical protein
MDLKRRPEVAASEGGEDHDLLVAASQVELLSREWAEKMRAEQLKSLQMTTAGYRVRAQMRSPSL